MAYHFFSIPVSGSPNVVELNKLLDHAKVASVKREFVADGGNSFWAFCVQTVGAEPSPQGQEIRKRGEQVDYKEILSLEDFAVFARLREVRKLLAERDAVPAYSVATNAQLAEMVTRKVVNTSGFGPIRGFGEARVDKYGSSFLEVLTSVGNSDT
jgi:superfamily II DNA helicase RecQ